MDRSIARQKYAQQKAHAKKRGIEWEFTFDEWCEIWAPHWRERGSKKGCKVMCRTHDQGAYKPSNVRIDTVLGNAQERSLMSRCAPRWNGAASQGNRVRGIISAVGFRS